MKNNFPTALIILTAVFLNNILFAFPASAARNVILPVPDIAYGQITSGTINPANEIDRYTFNAQAGDSVRIPFKDTSGAYYFDPQVTIYNPNQTVLASNWHSDAGYVSAVIPATGQYTIWVNDVGANSTGNYEFGLYRLNNPVNATAVNWGQIKSGTISNYTQQDVYRFSAQAGDKVRIPFKDTSGGYYFDPEILIYDASGASMASNWSSDAGYLDYTILQSGTYYIWVRDVGLNSGGNYEFGLYRLNNPVNATAVNWGQIKSGTISNYTQQDVYRFSAQAGDKVRIPFKDTSGGYYFDPEILIYDASGVSLASNWSSDAGYLDYTILQSGTYYIWVRDVGLNSGGNYEFGLYRLNNPVNTTAVNWGQIKSGTISNYTQQDVYSFSAQAGDKVRIPFKDTSLAYYFDPEILIYDVSGVSLASNWSSDAGYLDYTIVQNGTYYIWVRDVGLNSSGNYEFGLYRLNNPVNVTAVNWGSITSGTISNYTQQDVYSFRAQAGDNVRIPFKDASGNYYFDPEILIYDASGVLVTSASHSDAGYLNYTALQDGTYYIWVRDVGLNSGGTYEFGLYRLNNPVNATAVNWGEIKSGTISRYTQQDVYSFRAQAGDNVRIPFKDTSGNYYFDPEILIYDASGVSLTSNWSSDAGYLDYTIVQSGIYYIWVRDVGLNSSGNYEFGLYRLNNPVNATAVNWGETKSGPISNYTQQDVYRFSAQAGDKVRIPFKDTSGGYYFDPDILIYDASGVSLASNWSSDAGYLDYTMLQSGTYYIWVRDVGLNSGGNYEFGLYRLNNPVNATAVNWGETKSGNITVYTQQDVYSFAAETGDSVVIPFSDTSGGYYFDPEILLYDVNGALVASTWSSGSGTLITSIPVTGQYYIWVRDVGLNSGGTYQFTLVENLIKNVTRAPVFINPNSNQQSVVNFELERNANVIFRYYSTSFNTSGVLQKTQLSRTDTGVFLKGVNSHVWDGRDASSILPSGTYLFSIEATSVTGNRHMLYDPAYVGGTVNFGAGSTLSTSFDPYKSEKAQVTYNLVAPSFVTLQVGVANTAGANRTILNREPRDTANNIDGWDGKDGNGNIVGPNSYVVYGWTSILPSNSIVLEDSLGVDAVKTNPYAIYPNLGDTTQIEYNLAVASTVTVVIKNPAGNIVRTLELNAAKPAGLNTIIWDGKDSTGRVVDPVGNYRVIVTATDNLNNQKVVEGNITIFR